MCVAIVIEVCRIAAGPVVCTERVRNVALPVLSRVLPFFPLRFLRLRGVGGEGRQIGI